MKKHSNNSNLEEKLKIMLHDLEQQKRKIDLTTAKAKQQSDEISELEDSTCSSKSKKKPNFPKI